MAAIFCHAIQIETDDGTGRRVSNATDATLGLNTGVFRLITGRPSIGSVSGDTTSMRGPANTVWYSGVLSDQPPSCSRSCDIIETGGLSSVSGLSFGIENTGLFFDDIAALANPVKLGRLRVTYWYVTSADGTAFAFTQRWQGVIDDTPFNETTMRIQCVDNLKALLSRSIPAFSVDEPTFPLAFPDARGKMIPVAIGRVAYSPVANVSGSGEKVRINYDGVTEFYVTSAITYTAATRTLVLITRNRSFWTNSINLVGKSVHVISGGVDQSRVIVENTSSTWNATISMYTTSVVIDEIFDVSTAFLGWTLAGSGLAVWYFEVVKYTAAYLASQKTIYDLIDNPSGKPYMMTFVTDDKVFEDASEILSEHSLSNILSFGFPGFSVVVASLDSGDVNVYFPIYPVNIKLNFISHGGGSTDIPAVGTSAPYLFDKGDTNFYTTTFVGLVGYLYFDVYFSPTQLRKSWDDLSILFDMSHKMTTGSDIATVDASCYGLDFFSRITSAIVSGNVFYFASLGTTYANLYSLPLEYFPDGSGGDDTTFQSERAGMSISSLVDDIKKSIAYNVIRIAIQLQHTTPANDYVVRMKEIGFVAKRAISITTEDLYTSLIGETFGSRWNARKTAANPIYLIGDAIEHLVRNYAYQSPVWQAGKAYVLGETVRPTSAKDNNRFYVVTVAGTTHASVEPTWPITTEGTVVDSTVTWTEAGTFKIDTAAFDNLAGYRALWNIGRTLTEKQSVEEVLKDIAEHSFIGIMTDAQGRISPRSWLDEVTPTVTFSETNILAGTLGDITDSPMRRVYNDFTVRYDYNPGTQKFNKQITVTKADQPAFPAKTDLVSDAPTSLGTFTITRLGMFGSNTFQVVTNVAHGLSDGDFVSLSGNTVSPLSYNFTARSASVADTTTLYIEGHTVSAGSSTVGTMVKNTTSALKWKTFVSGIESYADAKELWETCRTSYLDTKTINKLPDNLGDCRWMIDPLATDPDGTALFSDLASVGDMHGAMLYLRFLVTWTTWQKKQIAFEVDRSTANMALELYDPVYFTDQKLTAGDNLLGWITEIADLPESNGKVPRLRIGLTLKPENLTLCNFIYDTVGATNTITDTVAAANIITDTLC